jgi:hypothetical protein
MTAAIIVAAFIAVASSLIHHPPSFISPSKPTHDIWYN